MTVSHAELIADLARLGVARGDWIMVHASLKAIGPVAGGPDTIVAALLDAIGPEGTLMAYVSWEESTYEVTQAPHSLSPSERDAWPVYDPETATPYRGFGILNRFLAAKYSILLDIIYEYTKLSKPNL